MRLPVLLTIALAFGASAAAQPPEAPPAREGGATPELPVSLDRIREQLAQPPRPHLRNTEVKADFSVTIEDKRNFDDVLSKMDFSSGPAPGGGLYGYEMQRLQVSPTSRPLQQPYAAYSAGEFFTLAAQNLARVFLTRKVKDGISSIRRTRAQANAEAEVDQDVADFCAAEPGNSTAAICSDPPER
ncbi:MAG: hypothetical protein AB7H96_22770 [Vicinamibacterales bacterium]